MDPFAALVAESQSSDAEDVFGALAADESDIASERPCALGEATCCDTLGAFILQATSRLQPWPYFWFSRGEGGRATDA